MKSWIIMLIILVFHSGEQIMANYSSKEIDINNLLKQEIIISSQTSKLLPDIYDSYSTKYVFFAKIDTTADLLHFVKFSIQKPLIENTSLNKSMFQKNVIHKLFAIQPEELKVTDNYKHKIKLFLNKNIVGEYV